MTKEEETKSKIEHIIKHGTRFQKRKLRRKLLKYLKNKNGNAKKE